MTTLRMLTIAVLILASGTSLRGVSAEQGGIRRGDLQCHDPAAPGWEVIQVRFEFAPGAAAPAHSQPGDEIVHVIEGTIEYLIGGGPPVTLGTGGVLFIGEHKVKIELLDADHNVFPGQVVTLTFTVPAPAMSHAAAAPTMLNPFNPWSPS